MGKHGGGNRLNNTRVSTHQISVLFQWKRNNQGNRSKIIQFHLALVNQTRIKAASVLFSPFPTSTPSIWQIRYGLSCPTILPEPSSVSISTLRDRTETYWVRNSSSGKGSLPPNFSRPCPSALDLFHWLSLGSEQPTGVRWTELGVTDSWSHWAEEIRELGCSPLPCLFYPPQLPFFFWKCHNMIHWNEKGMWVLDILSSYLEPHCFHGWFELRTHPVLYFYDAIYLC